MSDEPFERFLAEVRKRFWKLLPVRVETNGPPGVVIHLPNGVTDTAEGLLNELPYTQVVRLLEDAYTHRHKWDLVIADKLVSDAASDPSPDFVRMALAGCAANALRGIDKRLKSEDQLRSELAAERNFGI
jgi:hypothetical protein